MRWPDSASRGRSAQDAAHVPTLWIVRSNVVFSMSWEDIAPMTCSSHRIARNTHPAERPGTRSLTMSVCGGVRKGGNQLDVCGDGTRTPGKGCECCGHDDNHIGTLAALQDFCGKQGSSAPKRVTAENGAHELWKGNDHYCKGMCYANDVVQKANGKRPHIFRAVGCGIQ